MAISLYSFPGPILGQAAIDIFDSEELGVCLLIYCCIYYKFLYKAFFEPVKSFKNLTIALIILSFKIFYDDLIRPDYLTIFLWY